MGQPLEEIVEENLPKVLQLLLEMKQHVGRVTNVVDNMLGRVKRGEVSTAKGLSFLEVKYHMLLSYLINLTYVVLKKCSGHKIAGDPAIERLVEIRTVLEKIRPIDHKLKYQIDKLVKTAVAGRADEKDPLSFKANPENMLNKEEDSSSESEDEGDKRKGKNKTDVYVPPKLAAVYYDGDETVAERQKKFLEGAKKRALSSSMMHELREEYLDTPNEVTSAHAARTRMSKAQREKQEYEEKYFTRLPITRRERHSSSALTTMATLGDEVTKFGNVSALDMDETMLGPSSSGKKRKLSKNLKTKKKGFKRRKFH